MTMLTLKIRYGDFKATTNVEKGNEQIKNVSGSSATRSEGRVFCSLASRQSHDQCKPVTSRLLLGNRRCDVKMGKEVVGGN